MDKLKLKKIKKRNKFTIIIFILILVFILSFLLVSSFHKIINPAYMRYAKASANKIISLIINNSIVKDKLYDEDIDQIFSIVKNNDGDIQLVEFNSLESTKLLNKINDMVMSNLKAIEEGNLNKLDLPNNVLIDYDYNDLKKGIIYHVPMGVVTNNAFLFNLGPKIPVRIGFVSNILSSIETDIKEYGINNAMIEVSIKMQVTALVLLPTISEKINVSSKIPIAMKVIQGNIPNFYLDNIRSSSNLVEK